MKDAFGQELAIGDDVAIRIRTNLYRARVVRFTARQATVVYKWSSMDMTRSVGRHDIIKMVEGDHKPDPTAPAPEGTPAIPTFVFDPSAGGTD